MEFVYVVSDLFSQTENMKKWKKKTVTMLGLEIFPLN